MKVLSLFDGCSGAYQALKMAGVKIDQYYASEIDQYAIKVSKANFPDIVHIGSVTDVYYKEKTGGLYWLDDNVFVGEIDLLVGGSPCQDLSIAKRDRKGLSGERSGLFWEYVRILNEVKPKFFILENVASMPKEAKAEITKILGVEPILINSALVTAQQRKRLYWVAKRTENGTYETVDIQQPEDRGIFLEDITDNSDPSHFWKQMDEKYIQSNKIRIQDKSYAITATYSRACQRDFFEKSNRQLIAAKSETITSSYSKGAYPGNINTHRQKTLIFGSDETQTEYFWRKLSVRECARLQGMDDSFDFSAVSKTQAYKMIGNGFNIPTVAHLLSYLLPKQ